MKRVAILGGGISGLTIASILARKGHDVTLFEREKTVGGLARTFEFNGQLYDPGPHEFCTRNPELIGFLTDLLGDDLLVRHKKAAQFFLGSFLEYPIKPLHLIRQVDRRLIAVVLRELVRARVGNFISKKDDRSFEHWVLNRFGPTMYNLYFKPYTQKVWGVDPAMLDAEVASERIAFNSLFDILYQTVLFTLVRKEQYRSIHNPLKSSFYYTRHGIGTMADRLLRRCLDAGCHVKTDWCVSKALAETGSLRSVVSQTGEVADRFDVWVNTLPVTVFNRVLGKEELNSGLSFRAMLLCFLEIPVEQLTPYHWIYFPDADYSFQRITEFSHFDAGMTGTGRTGICAELTCFQGDAVWMSDSEKIVHRVKSDLVKSGLLLSTHEVRGTVRRESYAYPMKMRGYRNEVERSLSFAGALENVIITGRQGLYKYCNMNECMEMSFRVAAAVDRGEEAAPSLDSDWLGAGVDEKPGTIPV